MAWKLCWDFETKSWDRKKKKPLRIKGENTGGPYPYTEESAKALAEDLCRMYGDGTHWAEEVKSEGSTR